MAANVTQNNPNANASLDAHYNQYFASGPSEAYSHGIYEFRDKGPNEDVPYIYPMRDEILQLDPNFIPKQLDYSKVDDLHEKGLLPDSQDPRDIHKKV